MRTREDFDAFLESELIPELEVERGKFEQLRQLRAAARLPSGPRYLLVGAGILVALGARSFELLLGAIALPFMIDLYRMSRVKGPAIMDVRTGLIRRVVEFWGPEFSYEPFAGVSREVINASRLIPERHDRLSTCDLVTGKHQGTAFRFSELRLWKRVAKDREEIVWSGLFIVADFNKSFEGRIFVLPDATEKLLGGVLARTLQSLPFRHTGKLIQLENPRFEHHFKVYGEDDQETRYVLSTSLMRRIVELKETMDVDVRVAFIDGEVFVALPIAADFFRAPSLAEITPEFIRSWTDEIHYVTDILDDLDLGERIWAK